MSFALYARMENVLTCFSVWNGRIAPLFDASRHWTLVDGGAEKRPERSWECAVCAPPVIIRDLRALGVRRLVCGAISRELCSQVEALGIVVVSFVCGDAAEIIRQCACGLFQAQTYAMPGCCKRRRRVHGKGVYR
jgi:hypothetical protein